MKGINVLWRDLVLLVACIAVSLVLMFMPHLNPGAKKAEATEEAPGQLVVSIEWQAGVNIDVDLWVKTPNGEVIWYSGKNKKMGDLLRDDLGTSAEQGNANYEFTYIREAFPGEYVVNLHLYRDNTGGEKLPISVSTKIRQISQGAGVQVYSGTNKLKVEKEEITVLSFKLGENGKPIKESYSKLPISLIAQKHG